MRHHWLAVIAILAPAPGLLAADQPPTPAPGQTQAYQALRKEYQAAMQVYLSEMLTAEARAKKDGTPLDRIEVKDTPNANFSARFLAIAERDLDGPAALDALVSTLQTATMIRGPKAPTWGPALADLREHFLTSPEVLKAVKILTGQDDDPAAHAFTRDVIDRHPDRMVQVHAAQALAAALDSSAKMGESFLSNPEIRGLAEKVKGKDWLAKLPGQIERARADRDEMIALLRTRYSDLVADLSVGQPLPPLVAEGLDGKPTSLADLKGKVVVLDIWATWCGPCKAMIPHERAMVERLRDKPFALVSVSADGVKQTLVDFLAKEPMPWTHWWTGPEGKIINALNIDHYPTIFVLDPKGIIRFKEIRGEELEKAVDQLLAEPGALPTAG